MTNRNEFQEKDMAKAALLYVQALAEIDALQARVAELNSISMSLAADVLKEIGLDESRTADSIRARVVKWRGQWNAIETRAALSDEVSREK